jgi:hypothetical protein
MDDLKNVLGPSLAVSRGDLNRNSLALQTIRLPSQQSVWPGWLNSFKRYPATALFIH